MAYTERIGVMLGAIVFGGARGWLAGGIIFGIQMSIARIVQGGRFLSDTLWAFGMVYLTGFLLSVLMGLDRREFNPTVFEQKPGST